MGYPLSDAAKAAFMSGEHQTATISVTLADSTTMTITEADIRQGGLVIDRSCVSSVDISPGTAMASELTLVLDNYSGTFNGVDFAGATFNVSVGVTFGGTTYTCPMGVFYTETVARKRYVIEITALDNMTMLDRALDETLYTSAYTAKTLIEAICADCGVTLEPITGAVATTMSGIQVVSDGTQYSCRQWLSWMVELMGNLAYMDWNGSLRLVLPQKDPSLLPAGSFLASPSNVFAYSASPGPSNANGGYGYNGAIIQNKETTGSGSFVVGNYGYGLLWYPIVGNRIAIANEWSVAYADLWRPGTLFYVPVSAITVPAPWVWPGDAFEYDDGVNPAQQAPISRVTFSLNGRTKISSPDGTGQRRINALAGGTPYGSMTEFSNMQSSVIDNKLTQYVQQDENGNVEIDGTLTVAGQPLNLYIVTGTLANSASYSAAITYPTGLNRDNCQIMSFEVYHGSMWKSGDGLANAGYRTFAALRSADVRAYNDDPALYELGFRITLRKL